MTATHLLDQIIANPTNHINNFNRIVDFGYDAKDCLKTHAEVSDDEVNDPLARRLVHTYMFVLDESRNEMLMSEQIPCHHCYSLYPPPPGIVDLETCPRSQRRSFRSGVVGAGPLRHQDAFSGRGRYC